MNNNYIVYAHTNEINGKIYIGITHQKVEQRWRRGKGYKNQKYFYRAITKYGWGNFYHEIIASNLSEDEAKKFEISLILNFDTTNRMKGYNITRGGEGSRGFNPSKETRLKWSKIRKGLLSGKRNPMYGISPKERMDEGTYKQWLEKHKQTPTGADSPSSKKVVCITTGEIFDCIKDAGDKYGIQSSDITTCSQGRLKSAGRHPTTNRPMQWQYYDDYINGVIVHEYNNERIKSIICITTGKIFESTKQAGEFYNIPSSNITLCCQGKYKKAGVHPDAKTPMIWMYYEEYVLKSEDEIIYIINSTENKNKIICLTTGDVFNSMIEASIKYDVQKTSISACCRNKVKSAGRHLITNEPLKWAYYSEYIIANNK